jgi:hypothetical protein
MIQQKIYISDSRLTPNMLFNAIYQERNVQKTFVVVGKEGIRNLDTVTHMHVFQATSHSLGIRMNKNSRL